MKEIKLTRGMVVLVDDSDYEELSRHSWYALKAPRTWYAARSAWVLLPLPHYKTTYMHRVIMGCVKGDGKEIDHIDGDGLNNTRANLRIATHTENMRNNRKYSNNVSGYTGVSWNKQKNKWVAFIRVDGHTRYLGYYSDPAEAARAYDSAAREFHGKLAVLNFPD